MNSEPRASPELVDAPSVLGVIEAILGLTFSMMVTAGVVLGGAIWTLWEAMYAAPPATPLNVVVFSTLYVVVSLSACWSLRQFLKSAARARCPHPVWMAQALPVRVPLLRPIAAAGWLAQFVLTVAAAQLATRSYGFVNPTPLHRVFGFALQGFVLFMAAYGSSCYLLFAVAALVPHHTLLRRVWSLRAPIDLALAIFIMLFPIAS